MRSRAGIGAFVLASAILVAAAAARPAAAVEAGDLTLRPAPEAPLDVATGAIEAAAQPGGGVWQSAIVTNRGRERFAVVLGGSEWLQPTVASVLLEPGQSETVPFTVAPPVDARPGTSTVTLVAHVDGHPEVQRTLDVLVTVLDGVSPEPIDRTRDASEAPPATAGDGGPNRETDRTTADVVLLAAIIGALVLLTFGMIVPSLVTMVKKRRRLRLELVRMRARIQSRIDARRIRRIVEASAAVGAIPPVPDKPTRADVRQAEYRRRVAERRRIVRAEEARVRDEARRLSSALWADRIREARELAEREAAERTARIERARRERAALAAALAEERELAEAARVERRRRAAAAAEDAQAQRHERGESTRSGAVRARSRGARRAAVAWGSALAAAVRAQETRTPPVAGEEGTRPLMELGDSVAFLDPLTGTVSRPPRPAGDASVTDLVPTPERRGVDLRRGRPEPLDVDELNRQLAAAPSHGTRTASAHSRSRP